MKPLCHLPQSHLLFPFFLLILWAPAAADLRINEVMASNVRAFPNASDFEDYPDWLELHNSSSESLSLSRYFLSDDPANPEKWPFPEGADIAANEHLVIVADGHDRPRGFTGRRSYTPRAEFTTQYHHTNFKLSSAGEEVLLSHRPFGFVPAISAASSWSFHARETPPAAGWENPEFDDSDWSSGTGAFGYEAPPTRSFATEVGYGDEKAAKHPTTYFRQSFTLPENSSIWSASLSYRVADGAIIFLNGKELVRDNLPQGPLSAHTPALAEVPAPVLPSEKSAAIPGDQLKAGENVFAVALHRADPAGRDLYFDFSFRIDVLDHETGSFVRIGTEPAHRQWSFLDDGTFALPSWTSPGFDDGAWSSGEAPLGYSVPEDLADPIETTVTYGGDPADKFPTTYFRKQFEIAEPAEVEGLRLQFQVDDGAVFYLNGQEVHRQNIDPTETVSRVEGRLPVQTVTLSTTALTSGTNTLAVKVVQDRPGSTAMYFQASLDLITSLPLETVDRIAFGTQVDDVSLGRDNDNPELWIYQAAPSPGSPNRGPVVSQLRETSGSASLAPAAGLYQEGPTVTMSAPAGEIRYTMDGTNPTPASPLYTAPLALTATTVIRARVYEEGKVPGAIVTGTYFVGETFGSGLPVLALTAPPDTLFDREIGIYGFPNRPGGRVRKGIDAPGHLEFFPPDGSPGFAVNGGLRLGGENNFLSHAQKAFNFVLRGRYGDDTIKYDLFPGSGVGAFTALTIREGGDDWGKAHLTDALFDPIARGRMEVETNRFRPAAVFINGEYWGFYNIRDRWDENWLFQEYGTNDGEYDHINADRDEPENGDREEWQELLRFLQDHATDDPEVWDLVESKIDLDSLIDFAICESWGRNTSWRGNREWWLDHRPGSKWRWFIPDMDRTFGNTADRPVLRAMMTQETTLRHLRPSPRFRNRFAQRAAAHLAETLSAPRIHALIEAAGEAAAPEIPRQFARWGRPSPEAYDNSLNRMRDFATARDEDYLAEVAEEFAQEAPVDLTLATVGAGSFRFAGLPLSPQTFAAFPGIATEIEALPEPGYRFDRWSDSDDGSKTTITLDGPTTLTAHFVPDASSELSGELSEDTVLTLEKSPYVITSDLIVPAGVTLTIEAGVTLKFAGQVNLRVRGTLVVAGRDSAQVRFQGRHGATWGGVSLEQPASQSTLAHLVLRDASHGHDPVRYPSAISGLDADVVMDFLDLGASRGPLFFRGGRMVLRDSLIDIPLTGDGLNVKQGRATTLRCTFTGNQSPDTDGIDYDGVVDGIIRDCRIYDFRGFNSDGIDVGEQCRNCLLEGNTIFYSSDKGISVGQGSALILRRNLIVGCPLGIAVKDEGSSVVVDQNTLVDCPEGVALYEKNFGKGGGLATITNTLFSGCEEPITADQFSSFTVDYSLSDTTPLPGPTNLLADPRFIEPSSSNYQLAPESPARDAGDPTHPEDPDGTRADIGARYQYSRDDYPFDLTPTVVVNEVLANSGDNPDWLELYNRSSETIDLGGWFLSDSRSNLKKFRIASGTTLAPGAFLTFSEDLHFGEASNDPGKQESFALSDTGETVYLSSAVGDQLTSYRFEEDFGPSLEGQTIGSYDKAGSDRYNFVPLESPTPGAANSPPQVGPVVISEIMYHSEVEYLELVNLAAEPVALSGSGPEPGWRIDRGIDYQFSADLPVTLVPGQRLILTEDLARFQALYHPEASLRVIEWTRGKLDNAGETVQLDRPGPLNALGTRSFVRIDRVKYDDDSPWDEEADGTGLSLVRISEKEYGNDFINWQAAPPTPGHRDLQANYDEWADQWAVGSPDGDPDRDGLSNLFEYAFSRAPHFPDRVPLIETLPLPGDLVSLRFPLDARRQDLQIVLESSPDLQQWTALPTVIADGSHQATVSREALAFYRLRIRVLE